MAYQDKLKPISGSYQNKLVPINNDGTTEKKGMSLTNNPLTNIGIGIGTEIGRGASGVGELLSKVHGYEARKLGLPKVEKFFKGAGDLFRQAKEEVYTKPFEEQRSTVSGKVGEAVGIGAQFLAPTGVINKAQGVLTGASSQVLKNAPKYLQYSGKIASRVAPEAVISGGVELARTGGDVESAKTAGIIGGATVGSFGVLGDTFKALNLNVPKSAKENIARVLKNTGGVKLGQITNTNRIDNAVTAFDVIRKNAPNIVVKDIDDVEKVFDPKKATFYELPQALSQTKESIYKQYTDIAAKAGDQGVVFNDADFKSLENVLNKYSGKGYTPSYTNKAEQFRTALTRFGNVDPRNGSVIYNNTSPLEIQDLIQNVNLDVNPLSDRAGAKVAGEFSEKLREILDNKITESGNPAYQTIRNQYSALKSVERDVVQRYKEALRKAGAQPSLIDGIATVDAIMGVVKMEPTNIIRASVIEGVKKAFKYLRDPEVNMRRAFKILEEPYINRQGLPVNAAKATTNTTIPKNSNIPPILPQTTKKSSGLSTRLFGSNYEGPEFKMGEQLGKKAKGEVMDFIRNPKAGMSIEDVTKKKPLGTIQGNKTLVKDLIKQPDIKIKKDLPITVISGEKATIPANEILSVFKTKSGKFVLKGNEEYVVPKNQFENIKGNAVSSEAKKFAPELEGLDETVKGASKWQGDELIDNGEVKANLVKNDDGTWSYQSDFSEGEVTFKTRKEAMENAEADTLGIYSGNETKYSSYQLPGGEGYEEILIKAPENKLPEKYTKFEDYRQELIRKYGDDFYSAKLTKEEASKLRTLKRFSQQKNELYLPENKNKLKEAEESIRKQTFKSSHWDEPNIISHLRLNKRTYNGKKVTFMEELQSDWAREGRDKGFSDQVKIDWKSSQNGDLNATHKGKDLTITPEGSKFYVYEKGGVLGRTADTLEQAKTYAQNYVGFGVPNNPLLKNWQVPTVKRALQRAVDNDAEYFAWINGDQTSARYNLATQVKNVEWGKSGTTSGKKIYVNAQSGKDIIIRTDGDGTITKGESVPTDWVGKKLDEVLGKGLADKIMADETGTLSGEGLKFGGEWANNLYDKQVKNIVEDLTGAKVEMIDLGLPVEKVKAPQWIQNTNGDWYLTKNGERFVITKEGSGYVVYRDNKIIGTGKKWKSAGEAQDFAKDYVTDPTKTTTQQAIKLTPEIKAMIRGEAPKIKAPKIKPFQKEAYGLLPLGLLGGRKKEEK